VIFLTQTQSDILKTLGMIYMAPNDKHIFPYEKTIYNILKGNPKSVNASQYKDSPYYGLYPDLRFNSFKKALNGLIPNWIETVHGKKKLEYHLTEAADIFLLDTNKSLNQKIFISPKKEEPIIDNFNHNKYRDAFLNEPTETEEILSKFSSKKTMLEKNICSPKRIKKISIESFLKFADWDNYNPPKNKPFVEIDDFKLPFYSKDEKIVYDHIAKHNLAKCIRGQALRIPIPKTKRFFYPDLVYLNKDNEVVIIEVKSKANMSTHDELVKYNALRLFCLKNQCHYAMLDKNYTSIQSFCKMNYNKKLETVIIKHLKKYGLLDSQAVTQIREKYFSHIKRKVLDKMVTAIIIKNRFIDKKVNMTQLHVINQKHNMDDLCNCN
jgi:hypothetical protein